PHAWVLSAATPGRSTAGTPGGRPCGSARRSPPATPPSATRPWIRCSGRITGIASTTVTPPAPATCAASSRPRTSTRPGNGIPPACTPISPGRWGWSTVSWRACPARCPGPRAPAGMWACACAPGPGRTSPRGPGPAFPERDRAVLTLLAPHLDQAYLDTERLCDPVPRLTPRQTGLLRLVAAGHTNAQIARRLGITEGTVRTHLENIYQRLGVSSRTAAVTRAFPDRVA